MAAVLLQRSASAARGAAAATTSPSRSVVCRLQRQATACTSLINTPAATAAASSSLARASPAALQRTGDRSSLLRTASSPRFVVAAAEGATVELEVKVEGMKCGGCSSKVEAALKAMERVKGVAVDLETKLATVEVEAANQIDAMQMLPALVATVKELGFQAEPHIDYQTPA